MSTLRQALAQSVFSHAALVPSNDLPDICWLDPAAARPRSLLILAAAGPEFWRHCSTAQSDPVDQLATNAALAMAESLSLCGFLLYPAADAPLDLVAVMRHLGWVSGRSPLGMALSSEYGSYIAMRAVFGVVEAVELQVHGVASSKDTCIDCAAPCVDACPAGAPSIERGFDIGACASVRRQTNNPCQQACLARLACPAGAPYRYDDAQIVHHHTASRWFDAL
ncbi:MAG: hypothetical protein HWE20_17255 [Gammaproteobacteria bacterium]|nr:hypothetical protein [Gammaproteobacteria bacterium]